MTFSKVGIVGAGQLGRMLALAGYPLGLRCTFLDSSPTASGAQVAPILLGSFEDPVRLQELAQRNEVVTFDWENIDGAALERVERSTAVRPPRAALEASQDRLREKALFAELGIPVARHRAVDSRGDLEQAAAALGGHGILKTRRLGYDGKGQVVIRGLRGLDAAWERLGAAALVYEEFQTFSQEVSLIAARAADGAIVYYPLAANTHSGGILRYSVAPFRHARLDGAARGYMKRVLERLDYIGVLAIEFFVVDGRLVANEMAPRVHNSGHWTIEGCVTSQFENHLRAICGLPLGSTRPLGHAAMINFIGRMPDANRLLGLEGLAFHDYGKEPRPGRKLGHCTILRSKVRERDAALVRLLKSIEWS